MKSKPHQWAEQLPGDPAREGCFVCGCERASFELTSAVRAWLYRMLDETEWSEVAPACTPARGRQIPFNASNARRALRSLAFWEPGRSPHDVRQGHRCPCCGYGATAAEGSRQTQDLMALEHEDPALMRLVDTAIEARDAWHKTLASLHRPLLIRRRTR